MKKTFLLIAFVWAYSSIFSQGIHFAEDLKLREALQKARIEKKYIFIDFYTPWCGPCKMMLRDVFPQKEVGDFYNEHFINLTLNGDDPSNKSVTNDYVITSYPTFIFLNSTGEIIHRGMNGMSPEEFLALGKTAVDSTTNFKAISQKIKAGSRTPELLAMYFQFIPYSDEKELLSIEYLNSLSDGEKLSNAAWQFFRDYVHDCQSAPFSFFVKNIPLFVAQFGKETVERKMVNLLQNSYREDRDYFNSLKKNDPTFFKEVESILKNKNS